MLSGSTGDEVLDGGAGNDTVRFASAGSAVVVNLSAVGSQATGGGGIDLVRGFEQVIGSAFNDVLTGTLGDDGLDGGGGMDIVSYAAAADAVEVDLSVAVAQATGGGGTDRLTGIEGIIGSAFDDVIAGTGADERFEGAKDSTRMTTVRHRVPSRSTLALQGHRRLVVPEATRCSMSSGWSAQTSTTG